MTIGHPLGRQGMTDRFGTSARVRVALLAGLIGITFGITACGKKEVRNARVADPHPIPAGAGHRDVEGEHGGRLVYVTIGDPKTFNVTLANEVSSTEITSGPLFVGLTTF